MCLFLGQTVSRSSDSSYKPSFLTDQELKHLVLEVCSTCALCAGGSVVRTLNLWSKGHVFNSRLVCYEVTTLGKLFSCSPPPPGASITKQYSLVPAKGPWHSAAGRLTVGLALHWPCITDLVVYPLTCSMTSAERWVSLLHSGWAQLTLPVLQLLVADDFTDRFVYKFQFFFLAVKKLFCTVQECAFTV